MKHVIINKMQTLRSKIRFYLQGTELNMFGRPISSEKIAIVPLGPKIHLTVFDASVLDLAALSYIKLHNLNQKHAENQAIDRRIAGR